MKNRKLIRDCRLVMTDRVIEGGGLLFSDRIEKVLQPDDTAEMERLAGDPGIKVIDGQELYLSPGFIDIHIHGAAGHDTMDGTREAVQGISRALTRSGVTSFLPTTMTMPADKIRQALDNLREVMEEPVNGARVLGVHTEGPFINSEHKGAQPEEAIQEPDRELLADYLDIIKLCTLAPEKEGAPELISELSRRGIAVSAGHTSATYERMMEARDRGLKHATHLFNGMVGLHHRRPGVVGAVLSSDLSCELIGDFVHIHPAVLKLVLRCKDPDRVILVTDQMEAGSMGDGEYDLGGQKVIVKDGVCRLENGRLASSVLTLDRAVSNILELGELTLPEAVRLVTLNPARLLGEEDHLGRIAPGYTADLVLFDRDMQIRATYIAGREIK